MDDRTLIQDLGQLYSGLRDQYIATRKLQQSLDSLLVAIGDRIPEVVERYEAEMKDVENAPTTEDEDMTLYGLGGRIAQLDQDKKNLA